MKKNIFDVMLKLPRINGFSTPLVGISWDNVDVTSCTNYVKKIFVYLEDKRVLFYPSDLEGPRYCVESILNIREFLTEQLMALSESQVVDVRFLESCLRTMRFACQEFLTNQQQFSIDNSVVRDYEDYDQNIQFLMDMVKFRTVFVEEIYKISTHYKIKIELEELRNFIYENHEVISMLENEKRNQNYSW